MTTLAEKIAIVTGASRGIGAAAAMALAGAGASVMLVARDGLAASRAAEAIVAGGGRASGVSCDVADYAAVEAMVDETSRRFGVPDILVNNAGVIEPIGALAQSDPAAWAGNISINLIGAYNTVRATLPQMLAGGLNQAVVSAAKRDSGVKYIVSTNGSFTDTLPEALKAAGLAGQVRLISGQGVSLDQQNVLNGSQLATVSSPLTLSGWQDVDIAIRLVLHQPVPAGDGDVPWVLLTKSNIGTIDVSTAAQASGAWFGSTSYQSDFEQLWGV